MIKKIFFIVFFAIGICFSFVLTPYAATTVSIVANGLLSDVASIQFDILGPDTATTANWSNSFPSGWFDFSFGKNVNAFDSTGSASLPTGIIGSFNIDVILGNWMLGNQAAEDLTLGKDFLVRIDGSNYTLAPIPIPSTIMLLAGGLMGLAALRWRRA